MEFKIERDFLYEQTDGVLKTLIADLFVEDMQKFRSSEGQERIAYASENMTPNVLTERGLELPEGMRVSSRAFEEPGQDKYFDLSAGYKVGTNITTNPDFSAELRNSSPQVYRELVDFVSKYSPDSPFIEPDIPIDFDDIGGPFDPRGASACGCACGGAATVCGGGGGGASSD